MDKLPPQMANGWHTLSGLFTFLSCSYLIFLPGRFLLAFNQGQYVLNQQFSFFYATLFFKAVCSWFATEWLPISSESFPVACTPTSSPSLPSVQGDQPGRTSESRLQAVQAPGWGLESGSRLLCAQVDMPVRSRSQNQRPQVSFGA